MRSPTARSASPSGRSTAARGSTASSSWRTARTTRRSSCWRRRRPMPDKGQSGHNGPSGTIGSSVRPYGDTTGDGMIQTSFTLPIPAGPKAEGAALQLATKMGIEPAMVVHSHAIDSGYTFFVVYGSVRHLVDLDAVVVEERAYPLLSSAEINAAIRTGLGRKLVVLGACIGTDAHTVGIDAILNVKGFAGEKGLEYL